LYRANFENIYLSIFVFTLYPNICIKNEKKNRECIFYLKKNIGEEEENLKGCGKN